MNCAWVEDDRYDSQTTIAYFGVTWLAHVVSRESVFNIQVDIKDIMHVIVLNKAL